MNQTLNDCRPLIRRCTNPYPKPNPTNPNPISNHNLRNSGRSEYTVPQENVSPLAWYNFDTCERILIFLAERIPISKRWKDTLLCHIKQLLLLHYLVQRGKAKVAFPSNEVLVHCLNSTSCLISSIFLTHDSYSRFWIMPLPVGRGIIHYKENIKIHTGVRSRTFTLSFLSLPLYPLHSPLHVSPFLSSPSSPSTPPISLC